MTGSTAVGVASDCGGGLRIRTSGYWSLISVTLPENDCCDDWPAVVDHLEFEFPVARDLELANGLLAARFGGLHGQSCHLGSLPGSLGGGRPRVTSSLPPESGRLLVAQTVTFVPRRPLTPSSGTGPS